MHIISSGSEISSNGKDCFSLKRSCDFIDSRETPRTCAPSLANCSISSLKLTQVGQLSWRSWRCEGWEWKPCAYWYNQHHSIPLSLIFKMIPLKYFQHHSVPLNLIFKMISPKYNQHHFIPLNFFFLSSARLPLQLIHSCNNQLWTHGLTSFISGKE